MSAATASFADDCDALQFAPPQRRIITPADLAQFGRSPVHARITGFVSALSAAVRGKRLSDAVPGPSRAAGELLRVLDGIDALVDDTPPAETNSRFGNPAFRLFYDKLQHTIPTLLEDLVVPHAAIPEVGVYIGRAFGDRKRIDYGTGHEANFLAFLLALTTIGVFTEEDFPTLILRIFARYIELMRKIQFKYWLEPAGSHGVWGLDDYHSLPFLFGASQLADHKFLSPKCIHDKDVVDMFADEYMYLGCIRFINRVKHSASLRWHSPMLDDISGVKSWAKVEEGMRKMYVAEVLGKLPIMQHFLFGSILRFDNVSGKVVRDEDLEADDGHLHVYAMGQQFPVCCGMRLPSAIAAREREGRPKGLPFD